MRMAPALTGGRFAFAGLLQVITEVSCAGEWTQRSSALALLSDCFLGDIMFRTILLLAAVPLSLSACTTLTAEEQAAAQAQRSQETRTAEEGGLQCRTIRQTGSRLGNRVCQTEEEWERMELDTQEAHDRLDRGNAAGPGPDQGFGG